MTGYAQALGVLTAARSRDVAALTVAVGDVDPLATLVLVGSLAAVLLDALAEAGDVDAELLLHRLGVGMAAAEGSS